MVKKRASPTVGSRLPLAIEIGKRLAEVRGKRSQATFARSLDIHKNTLGYYERGERLLDAWLIVQLREMHSVNPAWLLSGIGRPYDRGVPEYDPTRHPELIMIPELLSATMSALDDLVAAKKISLTNKERAELTLTAYSLANTAVSKVDAEQLTKLKPSDLHGVIELVLKIRPKVKTGAGN